MKTDPDQIQNAEWAQGNMFRQPDVSSATPMDQKSLDLWRQINASCRRNRKPAGPAKPADNDNGTAPRG